MLPKFIDKSLLPHKPGIYMYKDKTGEVIYVGKAVDLYSRVNSYFNSRYQDTKTLALVSVIANVETIVVESELEALILEANLIKRFLPKFNIRLTDDKDYLYIGITKEIFPQIITVRKKDLKPIKEWFGPFPSSTTVKTTVKRLRRVFPWCSKPPKVSFGDKSLKTWKKGGFTRACFYYHIRLCPGACVGNIDQKEYNKIIKRFSKFMSGQIEDLQNELNMEMIKFASEQHFEQAQKIKKILEGIQYLTQTNRVEQYLENKNFLEQENVSAIEQLQQDLKLPQLPVRIEAYDISNIQGQNATGSMVVLTNGEIDKSQYRKFKIIISGKPNDYAMHAEMMMRRLNHPEWGIPQLLLIDGGRGQVRTVSKAITNYKYQISNIKKNGNSLQQFANVPIYGIAKRFEWLYPPEGEVIKLAKRRLSLRLLQKIRNESHRFAITYHRKLRKKAMGI